MTSEIVINQESFNEDLKREIHQGFKSHSLSTIGYEWELDTLAFVAKKEGVLAGICVASFFWGSLHIDRLYVAEKYRKKGLGTRLINHAIKQGLENKCSFVLAETLSYQALGFYQKLGFRLQFTQEGFSYGTSVYYLRKELC